MFRREFSVSGGSGNDAFSTSLVIQGDFDGNVFNLSSDNTIPLGVNGSCSSHYFSNSGGLTSNRCKVNGNNLNPSTAIFGFSMEHFGTASKTSPDGGVVGVNCQVDQYGNLRNEPSYFYMGANSGDNEFKWSSNDVRPTDCSYTNLFNGSSGTGADSDVLTAAGSLMGNQIGVCNVQNMAYGNWAKQLTIVWHTSMPIFDTDAHLLAYIQSGGAVTEGLLNGEQPVIPDDYDYFIQNDVTIYFNYGLSNQTATSWSLYYRFKMASPNDRMCLQNLPPYDAESKRYVIYGGSARPKVVYGLGTDGWGIIDTDAALNQDYFRTAGRMFSGVQYDNAPYVVVRKWYTNMYYKDGADSKTWAQNYIATGNPAGADNLKEVQRANGQKVPGKIGEPTQIIPNGNPSFTMSSGGRILGLTSGQANNFFNDIFAAGNVQQLLDGTRLFGANQLNSIRSFHYLPVNIDEICTCSSTTKAYLGSYEYTFDSPVKWVTNNNKMINCGSATFNETYGDYRDYEPYCKLAVMLPYCGTHELKISNYINKTITIKYAVDVTTGACTAYLLADAIIIDSFDGSMQVNRPVTANDQQRQASAVFDGVMKTGTAAVGTVGQVAGGVASGAAIGGALGDITSQTAVSAIGGLVSGTGGALSTIGQAANTLQMAIDNPISTRGSYGGILGLFGVQSPYFIFAWLRTVEPNNELAVVGKPSGTGQTVGAFGGFLQTSAFQLASGFTGTDNEAEEIYNIVSNGIYL